MSMAPAECHRHAKDVTDTQRMLPTYKECHLNKKNVTDTQRMSPTHTDCHRYTNDVNDTSTSQRGIWLSGKTLDCRPRDCEFDSPSLRLKLLKGDMYWFFPGKCSRVSVLYTGHVKKPGLSCVVGNPVSCTMGH